MITERELSPLERTRSPRLGIILSAGGSAFEATAQIVAKSGIEFHVITDRECGGENAAKRVGASHARIEDRSRRSFSQRALESFAEAATPRCLLFFDRLVSAELFAAMPTYNVHPAALPAFTGLSAVSDAHAHRTRLLGCSLHRVDESVDEGPILAQIALGVDPDWSLARWQTLAFLMKVYCALVWCSETIEHRDAVETSINASHGIPSIWVDGFRQLQDRWGEVVFST